jgi:hypothetical protein
MNPILLLALSSALPGHQANHLHHFPTVNTTALLGHSFSGCEYAGKKYSEGAVIVVDGNKWQCWNGKWVANGPLLIGQ